MIVVRTIPVVQVAIVFAIVMPLFFNLVFYFVALSSRVVPISMFAVSVAVPLRNQALGANYERSSRNQT